MRSFSFNSQPEQWNQAKGYLDIGEYLWKGYYDASLSPGMGDDLEWFKRLVDHYSPKFRHKEARIKKPLLSEYHKSCKDGGMSIIDWFLKEIEFIEREHTEIMKKRNAGEYSNSLLVRESNCKRRLRMLSRELHLVNEMLNLYDIEKALTPKSLTDDIK